MTLENIVPSLEDCKRIPEGAFKESALVYVHFGFSCQEYGVACRDNCHHADVIIPAPTLAEIMDILPRPTLDGCGCIRKWISLQRNPKNEEWVITYHNENITYSDTNPATAALLLWERINNKEGE